MRLYVMKHFQCLWTSHGSSAGSYACRKSHSALSAITNAHQALKPTHFSSDGFVLLLSVELDADHYTQSTNLDGHPYFVLAKDMVLTLELLKFRKIDFGVSSVD